MVKNHTYQDLNGNNILSASLKLLYKKKFVISPILTYYNVHLRLRFQLIPSLSVIKIVKYYGVRGRGGGGIGVRENPTKIIASLTSVIKIVKYFGIVGGGHWGGR